MRHLLQTTALLLTALSLNTFAQAPAPAGQATDAEKKGIDFLLKAQGKDGAWVPQVGPAITAMVVKALVQSGRTPDDPAIKRALDYIETCKQKDGGYYKEENPNYNSCVVLSMYAAMNDQWFAAQRGPGSSPGPYAPQMSGVGKFLVGLQMDESKDETGKLIPSPATTNPAELAAAAANGPKPITKANSWYGGSGYGEDRPDLSNTSYFMEALHDSGVPANDPAMQKALTFVTRSQMFGETNDQPFAKGATDGGFIYTPVNGGDSKFGDIDSLDGGSELRSYGTMTYSGFKSMLYAGLSQDDPRVKAAVSWIGSHWTLDMNPGSSSYDGLFYYYNVYSKALFAWKHDEITDAKGVKHNWRNELIDALKAAQKPDGSWVNAKSERWFEGNPVLATAYAVLSLQEARK